MKLVAISAVKYGKEGETAQPGETFEVDAETGKTLIEGGSAATPTDYARAKAASRPDRERIADLEARNEELTGALNEKVARIAELETANAKLTADLEAATKPKK